MNGATMANGAMVSSRNWATWGRAWSVGRVKNKVPARDTATVASPAAARNCRWTSRASPLSPAPPEVVKRYTAPAPRLTWPPTNRPPEATARPERCSDSVPRIHLHTIAAIGARRARIQGR